jgi:hypothetical protein
MNGNLLYQKELLLKDTGAADAYIKALFTLLLDVENT